MGRPLIPGPVLAEEATTSIDRIELRWPGKDLKLRPRQIDDGQWLLEADTGVRATHPLVDLRWSPADQVGDPTTNLVLSGQRLDCLAALGVGYPHAVRLAYLDVPRIEVDDKEAAFRGESDLAYSTWLSVLHAHLGAVLPLLSLDGVVVVHVGDADEGLARSVTDEVLGRNARIGTIVWQRAYSPKNMPGMKEVTATHDCLLVYAANKDALPEVGLRATPRGYTNPDGDPRGPWKAEHKGAASYRENSDFDTFVPPYRWELVEGTLPRGLWRIGPMTGVIWGKPEEVGDHAFTARVTDAAGATAERRFVLTVTTVGVPPALAELSWAFTEIVGGGPLRVVTTAIPAALVGAEYSAALEAAGGQPRRDLPRRPGTNRYWEFARDTLVKAYARDAVYFGREGRAIPHPKDHATSAGDVEVVHQQSWWPGRTGAGPKAATFVGYTEDATKYLRALVAAGLTRAEVRTAKPEPLLKRLVDMFTDPGDLVIQVFGDAGDLGSVALKTQRRFVHLTGDSERDRSLLDDLVVPRLAAAAAGTDNPAALVATGARVREDALLASPGGRRFLVGRIGPWLARTRRGEDLSELNVEDYADPDALRAAVLTSTGFLPYELTTDQTTTPTTPANRPVGSRMEPDGVSFDGLAAAVVLPPGRYLTPELLAAISSSLTFRFRSVSAFYFRASDDLPNALAVTNVVCRRLPFDLGVPR